MLERGRASGRRLLGRSHSATGGECFDVRFLDKELSAEAMMGEPPPLE